MSAQELLTQVLERTPGVRLAVLFGSAARDEDQARSDLDVGVLLEDGRDSGSDLEVALSRATRRAVDLVRLDAAPPLLRFEVARDGRVLVERTAHAWVDFRAQAMIDWWDWAPTARAIHAAAIRRLRERPADGPS
jgi:uncharacterized protein